MAGGNWSPTEQTVLPGLYMNFQAAALAAIQPGARGTVMIPVKANWGPVRQFVTITRESEIKNYYTTSTADGATAYDAIRFALLGGANKVLGYRLADVNAAPAEITLVDTDATPVNVLKLSTKHPTTRDFRITTQPNLVDNQKTDLKLFEATTLIKTWTFATGTIQAAVDAINGDTANEWITALKLVDGTGTLKTVTSQPFAGGNHGMGNVVNSDYIDAQAAFETQQFNLIALDGMTDAALQTSFSSWIRRIREEGRGVMMVMGGTSAVDKATDAIAQANARSASMNHEGIINVGTGVLLDGVEYPSAMVACYVAGAIAGQKLSESVTYCATPFDDVTRRSTRDEQTQAKLGGTLMLIHDGRLVKIQSGINTLVTLRQGQTNSFKKIRAIRTQDAINSDLQTAAEDNYIGKVNNTQEGRDALIAAFKQYMQVLERGGVIEADDWDVYLDPDYHGSAATIPAEPDQAFFMWEARITDTVDQIFGTFLVK